MSKKLPLTGRIDTAALAKWNEEIHREQEKVKQDTAGSTKDEAGFAETQVKIVSGYVGSSFAVPEGKTWQVKRVTVSNGMGLYNILVQSVIFEEIYKAGAILYMPGFSSEAALLTEDRSSVLYHFEIMEMISY